jgi:hypothetical protein
METGMKSYDNLFITGCDHNTDWMLEWFLKNFRANNRKAQILVADFGMTDRAYDEYCIIADGIIDMTSSKDRGWFKKPGVMIEAAKFANKVCWVDTDCEVLDNIESVFNHTEPNKLSMVEDKPWSLRRAETWHNSGVVAFEGSPDILHKWAKEVASNPVVGDQEVLHAMLRDPIKRIQYIHSMPNAYNWLRLQLQDGQDSPNKKIMHWTGNKGKQHIKRVING